MERLESLIVSTWQGIFLAAAVLLVCRAFPKIPSRFRALLWWAVCLKLAFAVISPAALTLPILPTPVVSAEGAADPSDMSLLAPHILSRAHRQATSSVSSASVPPPVEGKDWAQIAFWIWAAGVGGITLSLVIQAFRLGRVLRRTKPLERGPLAEEARRMGVELGLNRRPEIRTSAEVSAPMVVRPWRPVVVLPESFETAIDGPEARMALAHELAHVKRNDLWMAFVPAIAQTVGWFNPLTWLAAREWAVERESACDAEALTVTGGSPSAYGQLLMKIVADDYRGGLATALGATAAYHTLRRRLKLMKNFVPRPTRVLRTAGAAIVGLAFLAALPWQVTAQTSPGRAAEKNLVVNSSFESGLSDWSRMESVAPQPAQVSVEIDSSTAHTGKNSLKFSKTEQRFFPVVAMNQSLPISGATRRLRVGMWVKASSARKATMAVIFDQNSVEWGAYVGEASDGDKPANHDWKYYGAVLEVPSGVSDVTIGLQMYGPGTVWIDDVSVAFAPNDTPLKKAVSDPDPLEGVRDIPSTELKAGNDPLKKYHLIGKPATSGANKLLLVMPGGDGSAEFNPFLRNVWKNAVPPGYLVAELVAPKWSDDQFEHIVWPTKKVRWTGMKFSTEEFIDAVVKDVSAKYTVDPSKVFLMAWSSGGPAAYANALSGSSAVKGSLIAMSVYQPMNLPAPSGGRGHAFYLLQSPDDTITSYGQALNAQKELKAAGVTVTLATYRGGHGWTEDPFGNIRKGLEWLEANAK